LHVRRRKRSDSAGARAAQAVLRAEHAQSPVASALIAVAIMTVPTLLYYWFVEARRSLARSHH